MTTYPDTTPDWGIALLKGNLTNDWRQLNDAYLDVDEAITRATQNATFPGAILLDPIVRDSIRFGVEPAGGPDASLTRTAPATLALGGPVGVPLAFDLGTAAGLGRTIRWFSGANPRWQQGIAHGEAETGSNAGSDFVLVRHADDGAFLSFSLRVARQTGTVTLVPSPGQSALVAYGDTLVTVGSAAYSQWRATGAGAGARVGQAAPGAGRIDVTQNARFDGVGWQRDDVAQSAVLLGLRHGTGTSDRIFLVEYAPPGANPFVPTELLSLWRSGTLLVTTPAAGNAALIVGMPTGRTEIGTGAAGINGRINAVQGSLELGALSGYVHGITAGAESLGAPSLPWGTIYANVGTIQPSAREAKTAITPLDDAEGMAAARGTRPVRFTYTAPARPPSAFRRPSGARFDWKAERDRLIARPLEAAARTQHGFVLDDPAYPCDPRFATGPGQSNPSNSIGLLLGAVRNADARITALEGSP